jgi:hypothetical protein
MGQEILYCVACQTQLRGADFDKRRAVRIDGKGYCLPCVEKTVPAERLAATGDPGPSSPPSTRATVRPTRRVLPAASSRKGALALGGAAALGLIAVVVAVLSSRPPVVEAPLPPPAPPPPRAIVTPPKEPPKEVAAPPKPLPDVGDVDAELRQLLPKEEFARALRLIEAARSRSAVPEWTRIVNQRSDEVHARAEQALKDLKAKAVEAKRAGDLEEPRRIRERLAAWELPRAIPELEAALALVPDPVTAKVLYIEDFKAGRGRFETGEVKDGALAFPASGVDLSVPFPSPIRDSSVLRFKIKPPVGLKDLQVVLWSNTLKANGWYHVGPFKAGEWQQVEVKASEIRVGYNRDGASLAGHTGNSLKLQFHGIPADARVLIDDFEIRE